MRRMLPPPLILLLAAAGVAASQGAGGSERGLREVIDHGRVVSHRSSSAARVPGAGSGPEQEGIREGGGQDGDQEGPPYNGRFTFVRIRYGDAASDLRTFGFGRRSRRGGFGRGGQAPWAHDYPRAETNFARILEATTLIDTYTEGNSGRVLTLDDPDLFKYPVASIIEVGYWNPTDAEVGNLRAYLLKGGFLIVDDFRGTREVENFAYHMQRVLPEYEIQYVPEDHEIYNSFFHIPDPLALLPPYGRYPPQYLGIFQDNDPEEGRLMVMINWNQDLQEYWEFSDRGYYPIDLSNEAYKFGVNYLIYAFTH